MTDKRTTTDASAGKSRHKRAAPTIDLKATEVQQAASVGDSPVQKAEPETMREPAAQKAVNEPVKEAALDQPALKSAEGAATAAEPPPTKSGAASASAASKSDSFANSGVSSKNPGRNIGLLLAAGVAGAAAMSLVLFGLWFTGLTPIRYAGSTATRARVTALEMQLQDLQKRPGQTAGNQADNATVLDALTQRVTKMEESIAKLPAKSASDPALAERVAAADNAMKALGLALTALNRRSDAIAADAAQARVRAGAAEKAVTELRAGLQEVSRAASAGTSSADLAPLQQRIAALEHSAKTTQADIAKASASDKAARLALSAAALRDAVLRGAPFADELAQAKSLGGDDKALAPLASFAATGVPSDNALAQELSALLPAMNKAVGAPSPSGSFIERLQANAGQLVRVRPLDAPSGDNASTVLVRIEIAAAHADIAAALAELGELSDAQRAPAQAWIAKAKNRQAALSAARRFAADAAQSLGSR
jgi:hypothetical protein